jgi:hypothetical protein
VVVTIVVTSICTHDPHRYPLCQILLHKLRQLMPIIPVPLCHLHTGDQFCLTVQT